MSIPSRLMAARILQPLRHRDFALLTGGRTISLVGDGFFYVALAWQVYLLSNDPGALSLVFLAGSIPLVFLLLFGGAFSDRHDRRLLMISADVVRAVAVGAVGILSITGQIQLWHIALAEAVAGGASAFFNPASTAIVPDVLPEDALAQANALFSVLRRTTVSLLGPALGGFVVAAFGPGPAFIVDALSFAGSAVAVFAIRTRPPLREPAHGGFRETVGQMRAGIAYVRSQPWIWATLVSAMFSLLFYIGPVAVLVPYLVKYNLGLGPDSFGTLLAFEALGAIATAMLVGRLGLPRRRVTVMFIGFALGMMVVAGFGLMTDLWQGLVIAAVTAGLFEIGDIIWQTMLQQLVPRDLLGRVSSLDWMLSFGLVPLSYALVGPVSDALGPTTTMILGPIVAGVLMLLLIFVPHVRDPERPGYGQQLAASAAASGQGGEDLVGL